MRFIICLLLSLVAVPAAAQLSLREQTVTTGNAAWDAGTYVGVQGVSQLALHNTGSNVVEVAFSQAAATAGERAFSLRAGEQRNLTFSGNGPKYVWTKGIGAAGTLRVFASNSLAKSENTLAEAAADIDAIDARVTELEGATGPNIRALSVVLGAEAADNRTITITVKDADGATVNGAFKIRFSVWNDPIATSLASFNFWPTTDNGAGTVSDSAAGNNAMFIANTVAGVSELLINDVNGGSNTTVYALFELRSDGSTAVASAPVLIPVTFD